MLTQILGMQYDEAAEVLDCPIGTVRSRVARARRDLVAMMREPGVGCIRPGRPMSWVTTMAPRDRQEDDVNERGGGRKRSIGRLTVAAAVTIAARGGCSGLWRRERRAGSAGGNAAVSTDAPAAGTGGGEGGDAVNGEQLARSMGCAGCHGQDFGGGAGPSLVGLAGSEVPLADGTTVVADTAYLTRSIANPSADLVADYNLKMPANSLSDAEIADIVAFIETLADG